MSLNHIVNLKKDQIGTIFAKLYTLRHVNIYTHPSTNPWGSVVSVKKYGKNVSLFAKGVLSSPFTSIRYCAFVLCALH